MSGIGGVFFLDGKPADPQLLESMGEKLAHRGPDGLGAWNDGSVGLCHQMLWTTPESLQERLPLTNDRGDLTITADARIDNRADLLNLLGANIVHNSGITDSELILAAYEHWGESCLDKLIGDFAFVIWNERRQLLFCARDHFGVKPLYYYHKPGQVFVFASEIKGLLCVPEVPRRLNEVRIREYLEETEWEHKTPTFYHNIFRLPPGHFMTTDRKMAKVQIYWSLDPSREVRLGSDKDYVEAFREIFVEAVRCRLRSAFPVGSMLSGGLDSSSVVCVARELSANETNQDFHTFSGVSVNPSKCGESPFIGEVIRMGGIEPHIIRPDSLNSFMTDLEQVAWSQDEPFDATSLFIVRIMYSAAQKQGVRVLLDGADGDVALSHRRENHLLILLLTERWRSVSRELAALSRRLNSAPGRVILSHGVYPLLPDAMKRAWTSMRGAGGPAWAGRKMMTPHFRRRTRQAQRLDQRRNQEGLLGQLRKEHWHSLNSSSIPFAMELYDRTAATFSIEARHPFFDKRLVEFSLALPPDQKIREGWTKMILRRAMDGILPEKVQWRNVKANLSGEFFLPLLHFEEKLLEKVIWNDLESVDQYLDVGTVREAYVRYKSKGMFYDAYTVWVAATLALWLRRISPTVSSRAN
ncbi:MAG: lasso peptide isopeptide bond-forming cyclase [Candidatus Neomarinimicrobiota bacterium]